MISSNIDHVFTCFSNCKLNGLLKVYQFELLVFVDMSCTTQH